MKLKRLASIAMALLLVASLPVTAFAQEYDITNGDITVSAGSDGMQYVTQENVVTDELQTSEMVVLLSQLKQKLDDYINVTIEIEVGKNYNLPKNEDSRQPQCPENKERAIMEALQHFKTIQQK